MRRIASDDSQRRGTSWQLDADLLGSFRKALEPVGILEYSRIDGVVATWWVKVQNELRTLVAEASVVADSWVRDDPFPS